MSVCLTEYVAWRGRYCAYDFTAFEHFLLYVLAQSLHEPVPEPDPWDVDVDPNVLRKLHTNALL